MRQTYPTFLPIVSSGFLRTSCIHPHLDLISISDEEPEQIRYPMFDVLDRSDLNERPLLSFRGDVLPRKIVEEAKDWIEAKLGSDPSKVSQECLLTALEKQAPLNVIQFIMALNPKVMSIPTVGPTPLQVAVQHNASVEIIQSLLEACPFGLCVTNPDHSEDPLSYAKRHHKDRPGLIELLSRPLSYWVNESKNHHRKGNVSSRDDERENNNNSVSSSITSFSRHSLVAMKPECARQTAAAAKDNFDPPTLVDREEINNVKRLCSQLLKAHKKMSKEVDACKNGLELHTNLIESMNNTKGDLLIQMEEQQKHHFYRQLIALDMKERAFKAKLRKMQKQHVEELESRMNDWKDTAKTWTRNTNDQIKELQILIDHESKVNAHFRTDLAEWLEDQRQEESQNLPAFVFATNLGEMNDQAPLCGDSSDGIEVTLHHVKKRPWRPLFKHWDRIMLEDSDDEDDRTSPTSSQT
ncbi:hypothetical protein IV203_016050 [Nitzschia inconspicua]|uniref:Uncharacterized protein n=1 Tax=Nitzschia inconspicua TaxID=303405 RepID=A0A9K3KP69_9STRA|nr:hypothetical protein IV203_016050 [Nitzschia inconspicua]